MKSRGLADASEIILEIRFGEGGKDSKQFVDELFSAYLKYVSNLGLSAELLDSGDGHKLAKIMGKNAGKHFQHESGGHVIQRVPFTEMSGRKQTSYVNVAVYPVLPEFISKPLPSHELEVTTTKGSGPGGQHRNKTETAVRAKHLPTGLQVFCCNGRSQSDNKEEALRILTARVNAIAKQKHDEENTQSTSTAQRGDKKRTYNFLESRATDHVTGKKTRDLKSIFKKGKFDLLF